MGFPELVIFDCDGVLADSEVISARVLVQELSAYGVRVDEDYVFRNCVGASFPTVANRIRQSFRTDLPPEFEVRYRKSVARAFAAELQPTPGIDKILDTLDRPACVATSSSPPRVSNTLDLLGMRARFGRNVFTASQVARGKPAPDLFLFAARQMGVAPGDCLVIEDSRPGLAAGLAAGMTVWHYAGGSHIARQGGVELPPGVAGFHDWQAFPAMLARAGAERRIHGAKR